MTLEARIAAWRRKEAEKYANPNALTKEEVTLSVWNHITRTREDFLAGMEAAAKVERAFGRMETLKDMGALKPSEVDAGIEKLLD
jgi:hypothetical protein